MNLKKIIILAVAMSLMSGCSENAKRLLMATGIGCGTGLAFGAVYDEMQRAKDGKERKKLENQVFNVFKKRKEQNKGKMVGLATGCLAGLGTGLYLNMMHEDIKENFKDRGIELEKETENGETAALKVKMDGGISFEDGKSDLKGVGKANIDKLSEALLAYPETNIGIAGHANRTGSESVNQALSESRAKEVSGLLKDNGVAGSRLTSVKGYASQQPLPGKSPQDGANRRVEVEILPKS
ncbi:OmpA family protein [Leptospira sp. GIMC2001]|uniref:OmpA family protein n=1 Tax=Leptospira sp. GIMC2001 TaxID=1513297 RepID=UPI00234AD188|nr:OmpA family protein [Leptospira sp. GIMC2001]WCL48134.1 OmpA family protein [Leptospira sp. GIMC2001]